MSASDYLENVLGDHLLRGIPFSAPPTLYYALHTADPGDTGANELPATGGYARTPVDSDYTQWKGTGGETTNVGSAGSAGAFTNIQSIAWPAVSADWTTVTHFSAWDALTGGNLLFSGALVTPKTFTAGTVPTAAPGTLNVTVG